MRPLQASFVAAGLMAAGFAALPGRAAAQGPVVDRYFPLDHRVPGQAVEWNRAIHPHAAEYVQQVRIELPSIGLITYYDGSAEREILTQAPSQVGMNVGRLYRFRISGMPEYPGVNLYPTVELMDRLHPPEGREHDFPIPIQFTAEEIETALDDRLVTKVIYLEQPQWAVPQEPERPMRVVDLSPSANLLQSADRRGRAMAIVRLGGRTPGQHGGNEGFYGETAPVMTQSVQRDAEAQTRSFRGSRESSTPFSPDSRSSSLVSNRD